MKIRVIQQEKNFVAVHKPAGFVTYADSPEQVVISAQAVTERQLKKKLFPVHRIDKDTCGVLVFAASPQTAKNLTALFRGRSVKKRYLAVVHGKPEAKGLISKPLERNKSKEAEAAETEYVRLATVEVEWEGEKREYSLVRCEPALAAITKFGGTSGRSVARSSAIRITEMAGTMHAFSKSSG